MFQVSQIYLNAIFSAINPISVIEHPLKNTNTLETPLRRSLSLLSRKADK